MRTAHISAIAMAAAIAAGSEAILGRTSLGARIVVPRRQHDPERLAAAQAKRARKNAKRLRDSHRCR